MAPQASQEDPRTAALLHAVRTLSGGACRACADELCGHEVVLSVLLGYREAPRCAGCLAGESGEAPAALCERVLGWLRARDCYRAAWELAGAREDEPGALRPSCLFGAAGARATPGAPRPVARAASVAPDGPGLLPSDDDLDAGEKSCGELVLELRQRLAGLEPREVLRVVARDPAAPVDLPAWCGLTGHRLVAARHPLYWIERKEDR